MKSNIQITIILLLFLFGTSNCTGSPKDIEEKDGAKQKIESFFKTYEKSGGVAALDSLFYKKINTTSEEFINLRDTLSQIELRAGKYVGNELIIRNQVGKSLVYFSYLVKYSNQPLRFTFMFYKPKDEWFIYQFKFDTDAEKELEESGRIYYLYK